jgi:hypothetical protein
MTTIARTCLWSEISYRKPPRTCTIKRIFPASNEGWTQQKKRSMTEKEAGAGILMRLPEQFLELVSVFQKANRTLNIFFS